MCIKYEKNHLKLINNEEERSGVIEEEIRSQNEGKNINSNNNNDNSYMIRIKNLRKEY